MQNLGEYKLKQYPPAEQPRELEEQSVGVLPEQRYHYSTLIVTTVTAALWSPQEELRLVMY